MASEVGICNLALANLGDSATVSSINPPEGSAQAEHCQRFYPIARDALLDDHPWTFTLKRVALAQLENNITEWQYCYALPSDCVNVISILASDAIDDYDGALSYPSYLGYQPVVLYGAPQDYQVEINDTGAGVIYTNQELASCRYSFKQTDTTKFSPMFVIALSWRLSAMLAGPIIKGDTGFSIAAKCMQMGELWTNKAKESDSMQRQKKITHNVPWISGR